MPEHRLNVLGGYQVLGQYPSNTGFIPAAQNGHWHYRVRSRTSELIDQEGAVPFLCSLWKGSHHAFSEHILHSRTFDPLMLHHLFSSEEAAIIKQKSEEIYQEARSGQFQGEKTEHIQPSFE